jgi:DNA polymerase-1
MALIFDIETDGLLDELTKVHCLVLVDTETGQTWDYEPNTVDVGVTKLMHYANDGGQIIGHNVIKFDIPAIRKVYPWFTVPQSSVIDTLNLTRLIWPDLYDTDRALVKQGRLPPQLSYRHSLEAWGHRLGVMKDDYTGDETIEDEKLRKATKWAAWNPTMHRYCIQDGQVTLALYRKCILAMQVKGFSEQSMWLEMQVQWIIARQERRGFHFDEAAAVKLYAHLVGERDRLVEELKKTFGSFYVRSGPSVVINRTRKMKAPEIGKGQVIEYVGDCEYTKVKPIEFNPGSRDHIANRLQVLFGWKPTEFTEDGRVKVDETVLAGLPYAPVELLRLYLTVEKRIGQIAEGKEAWLRHCKHGVIRGQVTTNGAVTGRMTHSKPNLGQVPASHSPYGRECRALFKPHPGYVLVGADADALELRDFAGYLARYDGGAYVQTVLTGDKKEGTDTHSVNARALGLDPKAAYFDGETGRDIAKTWFYGFLYGAGDEKLGMILTKKRGQIEVGSRLRKRFLKALPGLDELITAIKSKAKEKRYLRGLDGRQIAVRSAHSAPNTLLQGAGAAQMKQALVILDARLQALGFTNTDNCGDQPHDYEFLANVHDEWQIECRPDIADTVGRCAVESIAAAGEHFGFKCPLSGEFKVGASWADTH